MMSESFSAQLVFCFHPWQVFPRDRCRHIVPNHPAGNLAAIDVAHLDGDGFQEFSGTKGFVSPVGMAVEAVFGFPRPQVCVIQWRLFGMNAA